MAAPTVLYSMFFSWGYENVTLMKRAQLIKRILFTYHRKQNTNRGRQVILGK